jgi:hypothetical protein
MGLDPYQQGHWQHKPCHFNTTVMSLSVQKQNSTAHELAREHAGVLNKTHACFNMKVDVHEPANSRRSADSSTPLHSII